MRNASAVLHGPHDVRTEDRPVRRPGPGQVLVEIAAVGICGSDVHYYEHGRIGDHVVLEPGVPCRRCTRCLHSRYNLCSSVVFFATPPVDGSIARFVAIDAAFAHPAPAGLDAEQAAMAEPVSVGIWAARKTGRAAGDRVPVTGAGPIGLLAGQVARALGAQVPVLTDLSEFRLARARELGLRPARADRPLEEEFDVLLECSGAPAALRTGLAAMAPVGRVALVGTHRFAIEDTEDALTLARRDRESPKAVVRPVSATTAPVRS